MAAGIVANSGTFEVTTPSDQEIRLTRLFDAPRQLVFDAMTKPEHVRRWWGILSPEYSVTLCEIDLRVGGAWHYVGKGPRGPVGFHGVYQEIVPPERLVFTEIYDPFPGEGSLVTTVLTEEHGKTRMTMTSRYSSLEVRDMVIGTGMARGAGISYDMLETVLSELPPGPGPFRDT